MDVKLTSGVSKITLFETPFSVQGAQRNVRIATHEPCCSPGEAAEGR